MNSKIDHTPQDKFINRLYRRMWAFSLLIGLIMAQMLPVTARAQQSVFRSMKYVSGTQYDASFWQLEVRRNLFSALGMMDLMQDKANIQLNPKVIRSENRDGYQLREIEINSTPGRRIRLVLTVPNGKGPFPAVISIHGHGGKSLSVYDSEEHYHRFAHELAKRSYVTIAPFVSQHGTYEKDRLLMGERLFDCIRAVDYLTSLGEVDAKKIGCAGLSLGGEMTMWLAAMDIRIKAAVVAGFLTKMGQMEVDHCMCWKFPGLRELVDYSDIYGLVAPRPLLFQIGKKEPKSQFPLDLAREAYIEVQKVYNDFNVPENVLLVPHGGGHVVDVPVLIDFMNRYMTQFNTVE